MKTFGIELPYEYLEAGLVCNIDPHRTCSHCGVATPRDNAGCYRCGLEEPPVGQKSESAKSQIVAQ